MRKTTPIAILAAALAFAAFPGLQNGASKAYAESKSVKDSLVVRVNADPTSFCPYTSGYGNSLIVTKSVFETLVTKDNGGNVYPGLATEWKWAPDGKSIAFKIRKGVTFHNGEPLTADDVLWSLGTFRVSRNITESIFDLKNIKKTGENDIVIPLLKAAGDALVRLCDISYSIANRKAIEGAGDGYVWRPVGTGPYKFVSWAQGDEAVLTANEKYWGGVPKTKKLVMRVIKEDTQAAIELELGKVDLVVGPAGTDVARVAAGKTKGMSVGSFRDGNVWNLFFNFQKKWSADINLRRAISYAINKENIVKAVYNGNASIATQPMSRQFEGAYIKEYESNPPYPYNPKKAKELLAAAGYKAGSLRLKIVTDQDPSMISTAELLKKDLEDVGIGLDIASYDGATTVGEFISGTEDDVHMNITLSGNGYPIVYLKFSDPTYSPNWDHASDSGLFDEVYKCYTAALASTTKDACFKNVGKGVKIEVDQALMVPLVEPVTNFLYNSNWKDLGYINGRDFSFKNASYKAK